MLQLNQPFSVEGHILSSHLTEPETDYESQTTYHSVQIMVSDLGVLDELDLLFKQNEPLHQDLDVIGVDHSSYSITAYTLNAPRLPKSLQGGIAVGTEVALRIKADIREGDVSSTGRLLLVQVNELVDDNQFDWTQLPDTFDF